MRAAFWVLISILVLGVVGMLMAQAPRTPQLTPPQQGTVIVEAQPDGTLVQRTADGKILQTFTGRIGQVRNGYGAAGYPAVTRDGRTAYIYGPANDPEAAKLYNEEMQASQKAQKIIADHRAASSDADREKLKAQLREHLSAIFELQQKRRAAEIAKIEERLGKLKDTMKKRSAAKESIVDRRLDVLTGGVDELGWEDTFPLRGGVNFFQPANAPYDGPALVPSVGEPQLTPPAVLPPPTTVPAPGAAPAATPALPGTTVLPPTQPAPVPVAPRATSPATGLPLPPAAP